MSSHIAIRLHKSSMPSDFAALITLTIGQGKGQRHVYLTDDEAQMLSNKLQSLAKSQGDNISHWIRKPVV